jgi:PAS domain S-box-containing protein
MALAPQRWSTAATLFVVSAAYYLAAEAAFAIGTLTQMFAPFWPPNVVLLCTLLMVRRRHWPLYILAVFPAHAAAELGVGMPVPQLLAAFACNVAVATLNAAGLRYLIGGPPWLGTLRNVGVYILVAVMVAPGAVSLVAGLEPTLGDGELSLYGTYAWRWYLSNALGSLTLAPVFLAWYGERWFRPGAPSVRRFVETAALGIGIIAASSLAFGSAAGSLSPALLYAPIPMILWAAVRFGVRGASSAILLVTVLALWHVMQRHGPFVGSGVEQSVVPMQLFLAAMSAPVLIVAALIEELRRANDRLASVLSGISDCYYTLDRSWRFTAINSKAAAWFGFGSSDRLVGQRYEEVLGKPAAEAASASIGRAFAKASGAELPSVARPGQWIDLHAYPSSEGVSVFFRDITERKSTQLALQRNMEYLQLANEAAGIGTWEWNIATGELTWSPELYRLFGVDPQLTKAGLQQAWLNALHPEDRDWVAQAARSALAARKPFSHEFRILRDGGVHWIISRGKVIRDKSGQAERFIGANIDITERKRAEEKLHRTNERLCRLMDQMTEYQFSLDRGWRLTECNGASADILGRQHDQLVGRTLGELIPSFLGSLVEDEFVSVFDNRQAARFEARFPPQSERWLEFNVYPVPDGITILATDISPRKTAELQASATRALLQSSLDALSAHIAILDLEGRVVAVNAAWRSFAEDNGFRRFDDLVGRPYLEVCEEARPQCGQKRAIALGLKDVIEGRVQEYRVEYPCHCSQKRRWFQFRATWFGEAVDRRVVVAHEGITEVKRAEEALRRLTRRMLQVQDSERRRIARDLHDSTAQHLVGAAIGIARAARLHPKLDDIARATLDESADLIAQALREIRTVSYLLHPPMLDETGLPAAVRWYVEGFARRSGIAVDLYISPNVSERRLNPEIETTLFRILQEALTNVHRHSGSATARVRLIRSGTPESQVLLVVEDDGLGQGRTASSPPLAVEGRRPDDIEGVGVGVAGMRERLTQLKGRLEFLTAAHGTVVRAYIPCGRPAARRARQLKGSERPSSVALKDDASERAPFDTGQ